MELKKITEFPPVSENCRVPSNSPKRPNFPRTVFSDRQQTHDPARSSYQTPNFPRTVVSDRQQTHGPAHSKLSNANFPRTVLSDRQQTHDPARRGYQRLAFLSDRQQTYDPARSSHQAPNFFRTAFLRPTTNSRPSTKQLPIAQLSQEQFFSDRQQTHDLACSSYLMPNFLRTVFVRLTTKHSSCQTPSFPRTCWSYQHAEQGRKHSRPAILSKLYQGLHDVFFVQEAVIWRSVSDRTHCVSSYLRPVFTYASFDGECSSPFKTMGLLSLAPH